MLSEKWESIKDYEGLYEISNRGAVKSLEKNIESFWGTQKVKIKRKERILKWSFDRRGYPQVKLSKDGNMKNFRVHVLVWEAFGEGKRNGRLIQIDHIDEDKKNPAITNLRLVTNRQNVSSFILNKKKSGLPTGVSYDYKRVNHINKYAARIKIGDKNKYLGRFPTIELAAQAYNKALNTLLIY